MGERAKGRKGEWANGRVSETANGQGVDGVDLVDGVDAGGWRAGDHFEDEDDDEDEYEDAPICYLLFVMRAVSALGVA